MPNLSQLYQFRFNESDLPQKNEIWKTLCQHYFNKLIKPTDSVLDLACGYGEFINNVNAKVKIGVDMNPDVKRFLNPNVKFYETSATSISDVVEEPVDVIFTSNFLEHLRDKEELDAVFSGTLRALKPGGKFIVMGPNIKYLYAEYWDFYDHYLPLSHLSLEEGLVQAGYKVETVIPKFLPYTTRSALPKHPLLIAAYLRFPLAWRFLGKQFLVIASKPMQPNNVT
jgi:SAM-dependent methyltransferase